MQLFKISIDGEMVLNVKGGGWSEEGQGDEENYKKLHFFSGTMIIISAEIFGYLLSEMMKGKS